MTFSFMVVSHRTWVSHTVIENMLLGTRDVFKTTVDYTLTHGNATLTLRS